MQNFKDNFSVQAGIYAKYRPQYPKELYTYLASLTKEHSLAWDCGTGNGQAAVGLADYYDKIIATDPSEEQIRNCFPHTKVRYLVEKAERTFIPSGSVDLLTVANAMHWFDLDLFYNKAKRVLKKNGIIAAWCYVAPSVSPEINNVIKVLHDVTLDAFWQPENRLVEKEYSTIPFPFTELAAPEFVCEKMMSLNDLVGYLTTWSAVQRFIKANQYNPTDLVREKLSMLWPDPAAEKKHTWILTLKVGRIN